METVTLEDKIVFCSRQVGVTDPALRRQAELRLVDLLRQAEALEVVTAMPIHE